MKLSDYVGGTCDTLPSSRPTNRDVLQFLLYFNEEQPNKPVNDVSYSTSSLLLSHYRPLNLYPELHPLYYINR